MVRSDIQRLMVKKGYDLLGSGVYGTVYQSADPSKVIKVGLLADMWPIYITWALKNDYLGSWSPKVYSMVEHDDCYVAICERLEPLPRISQIYHFIDRLYHETNIPFINKLRQFYSDYDANCDIAFNNTMHRNGQIVFTDPACGQARNTAHFPLPRHCILPHCIERETISLSALYHSSEA